MCSKVKLKDVNTFHRSKLIYANWALLAAAARYKWWHHGAWALPTWLSAGMTMEWFSYYELTEYFILKVEPNLQLRVMWSARCGVVSEQILTQTLQLREMFEWHTYCICCYSARLVKIFSERKTYWGMFSIFYLCVRVHRHMHTKGWKIWNVVLSFLLWNHHRKGKSLGSHKYSCSF